MKTMHYVFSFLLFSSLCAQADSRSKYYQELKKLKNNPEYELMFDRKRRNTELQELQRDIKNYGKLSWAQKIFSFLYFDSLVVSAETMPKLYSYIEKLCQENNIHVPVITISRDKGILNAAAKKLFASTGGILIGQDLLKECSDEEIEAIIAHEIGHIKHEHVNNTLITRVICYFATTGLLYKLNFFNRADLDFEHRLNLSILKFMAIIFMGNTLAQLLIGKSFEQEADEFACKSGKAKGLIKFFERLEKEEERNDEDFERIRALLDSANIPSSDDSLNFNIRYYTAKIGYKINQVFKWLYHNTRFGAHPSNKDRIAHAQKHLDG